MYTHPGSIPTSLAFPVPIWEKKLWKPKLYQSPRLYAVQEEPQVDSGLLNVQVLLHLELSQIWGRYREGSGFLGQDRWGQGHSPCLGHAGC